MASPRKFNLKKEFKDICEELDYDPSYELIVRRNDLAEEAGSYEALADEELGKGEDVTDQHLINGYLEQAEAIRIAVERIDFKLMPYLYGRKSSHSVETKEGDSLLEAFSKAVANNIPKPNGSGKAVKVTQH